MCVDRVLCIKEVVVWVSVAGFVTISLLVSVLQL